MNTKRKGTRAEHRAMRILEAAGYVCTRASASLGLFDVVAVGANRENGQRMTSADKKHAIVLALTAWPEKSQRAIAEQIGCSDVYISQVKKTHVQSTSHLPDRVLGKDGKSYPATRQTSGREHEALVSMVPRLPRDPQSGAAGVAPAQKITSRCV